MASIPLTRGKFTIVDDADFEWLNQWKWFYTGNGYAARHTGPAKDRKILYMHRLIMNPPNDREIDHIDRNKLNNQRTNLRIVTRLENMQNRNKYNRGAFGGSAWQLKKSGRWTAVVRENGSRRTIGTFTTKELAREAIANVVAKIRGNLT